MLENVVVRTVTCSIEMEGEFAGVVVGIDHHPGRDLGRHFAPPVKIATFWIIS